MQLMQNASNAVYIRIVAYVLSSAAMLIPASWADWVSYQTDQQMIVVSIPGAATAIVGGIMLASGIFAIWGKK
mgnify:FL=1